VAQISYINGLYLSLIQQKLRLSIDITGYMLFFFYGSETMWHRGSMHRTKSGFQKPWRDKESCTRKAISFLKPQCCLHHGKALMLQYIQTLSEAVSLYVWPKTMTINIPFPLR